MTDQTNQAQAATQEQAKDVKDQAATQGQDTTQAGAVSPTPEELKKAIDALENSSKEIQGLNRKISEMEKAAKQKEIEALKGTEREKAEAELLRQEKEKLLQENKEIVKSRIKDRELFSAGIPTEFAKRIIGETEDEIITDVKGFKEFIDKLVNTNVETEIKKRLGGKAPISGDAPKVGDLQSVYNEAIKIGNVPLQIAIKRKAASEGVILNQ